MLTFDGGDWIILSIWTFVSRNFKILTWHLLILLFSIEVKTFSDPVIEASIMDKSKNINQALLSEKNSSN